MQSIIIVKQLLHPVVLNSYLIYCTLSGEYFTWPLAS
jgi:hypothetical protein